jgi:hypothetical protein
MLLHEETEYIFMCDMMQIYICYLTVSVLHELQDITYVSEYCDQKLGLYFFLNLMQQVL